MATDRTTGTRSICPSCGQKAKRVSVGTLRALLDEQCASQFVSDGHADCADDGCKSLSGNTGWRFCESQDCDVVYFSEEGHTTFRRSQLKVSVGVKETAGERPLCYCFGHSIASIQDELRTKGHSNALEDIRAKMKNPGCRCETENPSGSCCLGSVSQGVQIAQSELGMGDEDLQALTPPAQSSTGKAETFAKVGTVVSAIIASSCCWLPLLLVVVGVSGAGIASTLEAYRPLFIVFTFGFLGAAYYFTYRPKKAAIVGRDHDCCATEASDGEGCCSANTEGRFGMMELNKLMLWGVTVMAIAFLLFPSYVGALIGGDGKAVTENMHRTVITVEGMTCEGCAALVTNAIRTIPGVLAVEVDYETHEAVIGTDVTSSVYEEAILNALKAAGYKGTFPHGTEGAVTNASHFSNEQPTRISAGDEPLSQMVFQIDGMTCEGCAAGLSEAIGEVDGVVDVNIDVSSGVATVSHPACCIVLPETIMSAVRVAGFEGSLIE